MQVDEEFKTIGVMKLMFIVRPVSLSVNRGLYEGVVVQTMT